MRNCRFLLVLPWWMFFAWTSTSLAQTTEPASYGMRNAFGLTAEYSNDSSRILLGEANHVKLGATGMQYQRRLLATRHLVWSYAAEFRPVVVENIPTLRFDAVQTAPVSATIPGSPQLTTKCQVSVHPYNFQLPQPPMTRYTGTLYGRCGRESIYALGFSPFGFRINLRPHARLQPTFSTFEGYILSTQPVPIASAGSFNFAFEIGAGLEYYRTRTSSIRLEYQVQHYSNDGTAEANPGVDNGLLKLTYSFGR